MLLQTLKLQLKSCLLPFLLNLVFCVVCVILELIPKVIPDFSALIITAFVSYFLIEFVYSFFYGYYNFTVVGRSYDSLKHDKHTFWLSSLIFNLINVCFVELLFIAQNAIVQYVATSSLLVLLIVNGLIHIACFSLGSFYALYLSKYKILNKVLACTIIIFALIFYAFIYNCGIVFISVLFKNKFSIKLIIVALVTVIITIVANVLNVIKYKKQ